MRTVWVGVSAPLVLVMIYEDDAAVRAAWFLGALPPTSRACGGPPRRISLRVLRAGTHCVLRVRPVSPGRLLRVRPAGPGYPSTAR